MEQTTLQQRIEERAKEKLLKHLYQAYSKQEEVRSMVGKGNYPQVLDMFVQWNSYKREDEYYMRGEETEKIFNFILPQWIKNETDELFKRLDDIEAFLENKEYQQEEF